MSENSETSKVTGMDKFLGTASIPHEGIADAIKTAVKEGTINPIQCLLAIKRMAKIVELTTDSQKGDKEVREVFKTAVQNALDGGKSVKMFGATLSMMATGTTYDYSECGDSALNELYVIQAKVKELIKEKEDMIKAVLPPDTNKLGIQTKKIIQEWYPKFELLSDEVEETIVPCIKRQGQSVVVKFDKPENHG